LIYLLTERFKKRAVILIGFVVVCSGLFLTGPSKLLGLYNNSSLIYLGLSIMGLGAGMITIPVLPEVIDSVEENFPGLEESVLHNQLTGVFMAV